jgi:hypothetical protein
MAMDTRQLLPIDWRAASDVLRPESGGAYMARFWRGMGIGALFLLVLGTPSTASAGETWCDVDPVVVVTTPQGNQVPVFVTTGARGAEHAPAVLAQSITYTTEPAREGTATHVRMTVVVPGDAVPSDAPEKRFDTRTKASSGPLGSGTLHSTAEGSAGKPMQMSFTLDVP